MGTNEAHLLFEQSGTFKNEFRKLGWNAYDYDILDDFGETDFKVDLYKEIEDAYDRKRETIFDRFGKDALVMAFFPCVRFEWQITLTFMGEGRGLKERPMEEKPLKRVAHAKSQVERSMISSEYANRFIREFIL